MRFLALLALLLPGAALAQPAGPYGPGPCPMGASSCVTTATGGTTARSLAARAADIVNVKDYGALGDTSSSLTNCTIAASSAALSCAGAAFTAADVGKYYYLQGAGASNVPQLGTITAFVDATHVTLSVTSVTATPQVGIYNPPSSRIAIASAGSGYTIGTQTLTITGGTCTTQPQISVTVAANVVSAVLSMVTPGVCTTAPSTGAATTGGGGTGATFTTSSYQVAGKFIYGSDDTAAITAAIAAVTGTGRTLYFPRGSYWLASQTSALTLNNMTLKADGLVGYGINTGMGANLLISNKTTQAFDGMSGVNWDGIGVFYPEQDNSQTTPVVFPPLFEGASFTNNVIINSRFLNVYQMVKVDATAGLGRVFLENNRIYCVDRCFWFLGGMADVLTITPTNYFGPGAFDNGAVYGPANLGRYTATSGEIIRVDVSGGTYTLVDGLQMNGFIVQGYRYFIRHLSGTIDVSEINGVQTDNTATALSVEGTASIVSTNWIGGEVYSTNIYDTSSSAPVFNFTSSSATSSINISGVFVAFALGTVLEDTNGALKELNFVTNMLNNYGKSTTSGSYLGARVQTGSGTHNVSSNKFNCNRTVNTIYGALITTGGGSISMSGNNFVGCSFAAQVQGNNLRASVSGNSSSGSSSTAFIENVSGTSITTVSGNQFDNTVTLRALATPTSCGTTPAMVSGSSWQRGSVTLGTGGPTACTLAFPAALFSAPSCTVSSNSTTVAASVTSTSTTTLVIGTSADGSGIVVSYQCAQ